MDIVIRTDASIHIGSGHIMRCLVLANELVKQGHIVCFACRPQSGDLIDFIRNKGFLVKELVTPVDWQIPQGSADYAAWLQVPWQKDADSFIEQIDYVDLIIVDHYGINAEWEVFTKKHFDCKIFAIDDLLREHQADIILDQTLLRDPIEYEMLSGGAIALTGCNFALLNPSFRHYREQVSKPQSRPIRPKVLVSMGGIDQPNATLSTLQALSKITAERPFVTVLLSPKAPHYGAVLAFCSLHSDWITHVDFIDNMAELMLEQHIAIGAPGTTSWERACLGLPSIIVPLAENQKTISENLVKVGAAIRVNLNEINSRLVLEYNALLTHWASIREVSLGLCDGLGVFRVALCISDLTDGGSNLIALRPATKLDIKQVYEWQTLPETRKYALTKSIPTWDTHQKWMAAKLAIHSDLFYIIESQRSKQPIGVLRLDKQGDASYLISIFIDPKFYGQGIAKTALKHIDYLHPDITIKATVLKENEASQYLFSAANYQKISPETFIRSSLL